MVIFDFFTACHKIKFDELKLICKLLILFCSIESFYLIKLFIDGIW